MLLFCFGNNQANSSFVGSLVLCPRGGACRQTTFIMGSRNALISKRPPSLRVKRFTNFRSCLRFPSFAESVHKGPVCWLFGMQTYPQGVGMSPSKLWDSLTAGDRTASAPWLRHTGVKGSPKDFFKASDLLSRLVLSLLCSHFVVLINIMITQQTCFYSVCCCGS